jgi:hypothetical protein
MLTHNLEALHEPTLYPNPLPILLATSAVGGTVAKGSICLKCQDRTLWVDNVHCDPSATQNLFSVSAAIALGFSFESNDRGEHVALHGPEGFFCRIVRDRGLYRDDFGIRVACVRIANQRDTSGVANLGRICSWVIRLDAIGVRVAASGVDIAGIRLPGTDVDFINGYDCHFILKGSGQLP